MRLVLLDDMLERTRAVAPGQSVEATLAQAFERGVAWLETVPERSDDLGSADGVVALNEEELISAWARFDFLRCRALALTAVYEALDREVDELATESLELHERIWPLREREGQLKVALGRRDRLTPRPEPAPRIGSGGSSRSRQASAARLLEGLTRREVEFTVPGELLARARALAERREWLEQWGEDALLLALAHGLAVLEHARRDSTRELTTEERRRADPLALGALRYRVFELTEAKKILGIRRTALRIDNRGLRMRIEQLEQEVAELEREAAARGVSPDARPPKRRGLLGRFFGGGGER